MDNAAVVPDHDSIFHAPPHPLLAPFINYYSFRDVQVPKSSCMEKAMPFRTASSIDFFIGDHFDAVAYEDRSEFPFSSCYICGLRTNKKYFSRIRDHFVSFTINFKGNGLYKLLNIPMQLFTDYAIAGADLDCSIPFSDIAQRLLGVKNIATCVDIVEPFLLYQANRRKYGRDIMDMAVQKLEQYRGQASIAAIAADCNWSVRQLERNIIKEVGVSPKIYSRMLRFEHLLGSKIAQPNSKWASLAYDSEYFDQMHLVKEFKQFLGTCPSAFVPDDYVF